MLLTWNNSPVTPGVSSWVNLVDQEQNICSDPVHVQKNQEELTQRHEEVTGKAASDTIRKQFKQHLMLLTVYLCSLVSQRAHEEIGDFELYYIISMQIDETLQTFASAYLWCSVWKHLPVILVVRNEITERDLRPYMKLLTAAEKVNMYLSRDV